MNLKKFLRHGIKIDPLCKQRAVSDLIAKRIVAHHPCPRAAATGASIEYQGRPLLKPEAGYSVFLRIVDIPATANRPVVTTPASSNGASALLVNCGFELAPAQDKISLIVHALFPLDSLDRDHVLAAGRLDARSLELRIYFRVDGSDEWQVTHGLKGCSECAGIERLQLPPIRKRSYLPLRRLKVFGGINNHVVVRTRKEVQPSVGADDPEAARLQAC